MPENFYCLDNFFHKMTDIESPRKNSDCYFYYYSTCTKGDSCTFRHEPSALGCETTCSFWKEGKCINVHCNFRHMELRKNRKSIPCYWETQPGGCKKPHCPFLHSSPKTLATDGESSDLNSPSNHESDICNKKSNQVDNNCGSPVVDPLVVNFEEESDNESTPSQSPIKNRGVKVKTLEEIRLERIQAESAAYYSYPEPEDANSMRNRIINRLNTKQVSPPHNEDNFHKIEILSLQEIRKRKRQQITTTVAPEERIANKRQKVVLKRDISVNSDTIKIKSLEEIRLERLNEVMSSEAEVTSTSKLEEDVHMSEMKDDIDKLDDLLLEVDDVETSSLTLRTEEDILKDIDSLLNE